MPRAIFIFSSRANEFVAQGRGLSTEPRFLLFSLFFLQIIMFQKCRSYYTAFKGEFSDFQAPVKSE